MTSRTRRLTSVLVITAVLLPFQMCQAMAQSPPNEPPTDNRTTEDQPDAT
jgi:hypothetical protein